jgi:hypothetical protein
LIPVWKEGTGDFSKKGPRNCRSLSFARDDKKERVVVGKGRLLEERAVAGGKGGCWRKGWFLKEEGMCQRERDAFPINNCPLSINS